MADTQRQADIRTVDYDRISRDYFKEASIFKNEVTIEKTNTTEFKWFQKTSGFIALPTNTSTKVGRGSAPFVSETSWTRTTSYTRKYMLDTPIITVEDEKESVVKVFTENFKEVIDKIAYDVDADIWDVASESQSPSNINSVTSTAAWDAASGQDPFEDCEEAKQKIREETKRQLTNGKLFVSAKGAKDLAVWITTQGTKFTEVAGTVLKEGMLQYFAGLQIVVSENVTADYAMVGDMKKAVIYKEFMPMTTAIITEEGVGRKGRCWTHGVAILARPKYLTLISNTET